MASFWWGSKRKEEVKPEVKVEEPKVKPEVKAEIKAEIKPSFHEVVSNYLYNRCGHSWGTINSVGRSSDGVRIDININPAYLFPQPLRTDVGTLVIGEYRSKVNHISVSFNVEDSSRRSYDAFSGLDSERHITNLFEDHYNYTRSNYRDYDRHRGYGSNGLTIGRQVYLNSSYDFVSQNNELTLSEQSFQINIPTKINVSIRDIRELDRRILSIIDEVKNYILKNFQQEITKSKSEIVQKEFKKNITPQLVTDTFQHVIDLAPGSEVGGYMDAASISLFVPIEISYYSKDDYMKLDLNQKSIDIFYELMEGASRIKGEYDVLTSINFIQDKIQLVISPKPIDLESIQIEGEKDRERNEYEEMRRMRMAGQMQIRNPYRDLSIWE